MSTMQAMRSVEELVALLAMPPGGVENQKTQTAFRFKLAEFWQIPAGASILEVGCGQGDMTAVLADAVGDSGHVTAIDVAGSDSGAPTSLGEATGRIKQGPLGAIVDFHLDFDLLDPPHALPQDKFDIGVLAHCSWYFHSAERLAAVLKKMKLTCSTLCFSEWDAAPHQSSQVAHLLAALVQGELYVRRPNDASNIRNLQSRNQIRTAIQEAGWRIEAEETVDSSGMQDGIWEVQNCLRNRDEIRDLPTGPRELLLAQLDVLEEEVRRHGVEALTSFAILAR